MASEIVQTGPQPGIVAEHVEDDHDLKHPQETILKSTLDDLGLWATVKRFPKVRSCIFPYFVQGADSVSPRLCLSANSSVSLLQQTVSKSHLMVRLDSSFQPCGFASDLLCTGNIIANQGFANKIGFPNEKGVYVLNAHYTALWGAMQSLGQLVGMLFLTPVSDKIGRKSTMYLLWVVLCGVIIILMQLFRSSDSLSQ